MPLDLPKQYWLTQTCIAQNGLGRCLRHSDAECINVHVGTRDSSAEMLRVNRKSSELILQSEAELCLSTRPYLHGPHIGRLNLIHMVVIFRKATTRAVDGDATFLNSTKEHTWYTCGSQFYRPRHLEIIGSELSRAERGFDIVSYARIYILLVSIIDIDISRAFDEIC